MNRRAITDAFLRAALAYGTLPPPKFPKGSLVIDDETSGVQAYMEKQNHTLFITFRGSNDFTDWRTNLTFWQKTVPYGNTASKIRAHTGFIRAYKSPHVRDVIHRAVTSDVLTVQVAGHSHGAALSILCAVDLEYNFPGRDYQVFLFGGPRVGNKAFQKSYDKRVFQTIRVENGNDVVTKIPFASWGFRHVGIKVPIGFWRLPLTYSAKDHRLQPYYANLLKEFLP